MTLWEVCGSLLGRKRKRAEMLVGRMVLVMTPNSWGDWYWLGELGRAHFRWKWVLGHGPSSSVVDYELKCRFFSAGTSSNLKRPTQLPPHG